MKPYIKLSLLLASAVIPATGLLTLSGMAAAPPGGDVVVNNCLVSLTNKDVSIPALEPGPIVALEAKEGMQVKAGMRLGRIDDREANVQWRVKDFEYQAAEAQAKTDINIRFAHASTAVSKAEWEVSEEANRISPKSMTKVDINRLKLTHEKSKLQIEQAQVENQKDAFTAQIKGAEKDAAELAIKRRLLIAPFDGVVVHVYHHVGESDSPGDAVLRIVHLEHLQIEGFLNAADYSPNEVDGCAVSVDVQLGRGGHEKVPGKIVFVSPLVQAGGEYRVFAEVKNRTVEGTAGGHWLLRPGLSATMTIHLGSSTMAAKTDAKNGPDAK